ncbi:elongator complex protein 4 [Oratosquilla oratoria]|uniref:elongator complex protein 4 n=1 Tax=Oratosquilla oratoria TaxID=337810 RepID=UPI003F7619D9
MSGRVTSGSFEKKRKAQIADIPGTRPSVHNAQLLVSLGIPSLDYLLGGGLPVGSVLLVEEDRYDVYSKLFFKYFIAEGVVNQHKLSLASLDVLPTKILYGLPAPIDVDVTEEQSDLSLEKMTIAWRYQNQKAPSSGGMNSSRFGHRYDLTKNIPEQTVNQLGPEVWSGTDDTLGRGVLSNPKYYSLLSFIKKKIEAANLVTGPNKHPNSVMRIGIHSLASPLWGAEYSSWEKDHNWQNLTSFLYMLRALVRASFSVCMITMPSHLFADPALMSRLQGLVDFVVQLESFQGSDKETNPVYKDYHGLFHVKKLAALNTMVTPQLDSSDWVFNLKRRKLTIEKLHLPPELSETVSRSQEDPVIKKERLGCMGNKLPAKLDF